jgi:RNA polymerase sigma factor (sigma-70 family)
VTDPEDAELIARVLASDDRGAFASLVTRHQAALRGFLRRVCAGDQARADDLAQDAFVRAWGALGSFRGGSRFSTWLHRIAFNLYLTDRSRFAGRAARELPEAPDTDSDLDAEERPVTRRQLERALGQLSVPERAAVSLMYGQGATQEEIAELLDCPVGTVKTHLARGKQKLRALLGATELAPAGDARS